MEIIDGSMGEGGGQIVRTALALSLVTGTPFRIEHIRAGRSRPGLLRQHLTAVAAAVEVGQAEVEGMTLGSSSLELRPGRVVGGSFAFSVGTAGSATLVFQTVLPALLLAERTSKVVFEGGTHNPAAPPFDFIARVFLPLLRRMGAHVEARLDRPGFYPAGGGRFEVEVAPTERLLRLDLLERGEVRSRRAEALFASIPFDVARRELDTLRAALDLEPSACHPVRVKSSPGPGNVVLVEIESENIVELFAGFGERGVPAEVVAQRVADETRAYLSANVPVGEHLADQLLLPLALAGGGTFRSLGPTEHTKTQAMIIRRFLETNIRIERVSGDVWHYEVEGAPVLRTAP